MEKTNECFYSITKIDSNDKTYIDLAGRFPHQSSRDNNYILVLYNYDSNTILVQALKNRESNTILNAWRSIQERLKMGGVTSKHYVMDNEFSKDLKNTLLAENITFEQAPPYQHRRNAAERAIRTFTNHLLAGLATCDPASHICEWDRLLLQAELTINLLRNSRINPNLSAWADLFGNFDFNKST